METKPPQTSSILAANLEQIKWLNNMIKEEIASGTSKDSLTIRQMEYQREKYLKEINTYLEEYELSLVVA
ncbi:MAG: hypothetical protein HC912_03725 [Saprospiraceae bacterium]|nr:hypothetical protein [Saprospiraceae bacterium]